MHANKGRHQPFLLSQYVKVVSVDCTVAHCIYNRHRLTAVTENVLGGFWTRFGCGLEARPSVRWR